MSSSQRLNVVAVLTSFNRKDLTVECLKALKASADNSGVVHLTAVLVDDKSSDGTLDAVKDNFPWVDCISSEGDLYWNRGMYLAMERASASTDFDYILWVNDDTRLTPTSLFELIDVSQKLDQGRAVVVGSIFDETSGTLTYGGQRRKNGRMSFFRVFDEVESLECDTMNGNLVLIPKIVFDVVGNLDPYFEHAMGDLDYGLRVKGAGFRILTSPYVSGYCSRNSLLGTFEDKSLGVLSRLRLVFGRKALPVDSWLRFTKRHGGVGWPAYFVWPYVKTLFSALLSLKAK